MRKKYMKCKMMLAVVMFLLFAVLVVFFIFVVFSDKNYHDLLAVNDDLLEQIDTNRENYDKVLKKWQSDYASLESSYGHLLVEHDELKKSLDTIEFPTYTYTEAEIELLALCVQCEAGEQNLEAQRNITSVILNRVKSKSFPDSIESVIYQKRGNIPQFSVAYNGIMDEGVLSSVVLNNVYSVLMCGNDLPENVLYFYSASLSENNWIRSLPVYDTIEGTVFAYEGGE